MSIHIDSLLQNTLQSSLADDAGSTLWIVDENIPPSQLAALRPQANLHILTNRFDIAFTMRSAGFHVALSDFLFDELSAVPLQHIVYRVSKERAVVNHCINEAMRNLCLGGQLHLIGNKDDGINTNGKHAEQVFAKKSQKLKHSTAYRFSLTKQSDVTPETAWLDSKNYSELRPCGNDDFGFISKPGIYGWSKRDKGSALLAEQALQVFAQQTGSVLDLGCGYGYLLLATKQLPFARRCATDNNVAAVHAAEASFLDQQLSVQVWLDDCGTHINEAFDALLCNPPFHQGFDNSNAISEKFIKSIRRLLKPSGTALVVVNQFIPMEKLAAPLFHKVSVLCEEQGFKVLALS
jgi:16S rRNA (guanine1207-N2)-methyltransferase